MKTLLFYTLSMMLLLFFLNSSLFYNTELFKKDILISPFLMHKNVIQKGNFFYSQEKNDDEKMIFTQVDLKKHNQYLVEFDLNVVGKRKKDFFIIFDFIAPPKWDSEEHEKRITLDGNQGFKKVLSVLNSTELPDKSIFRIFHYYNGYVAIKNLRLWEISSTVSFVRTVGNILLLVFASLMLLQVYWLRDRFQKDILNICTSLKNLLSIQEHESSNAIIFILLSSYAISVIVRFAFSMLIEVPLIASDELSYKNMAYGFFLTGDFYTTEQYFSKVNIPNVLYSYLISFSFLFKENFFIAIKLINSLIINLAVFPVYLISKEFSSEKRALVASLIILLLPTMNYTNFAMAESLYFTIFIFCFFFVYKSLTTKMSRYNVYAGVSLSLLLLTKPNAVAFFLAFLFVIIFLLFYYRNNKKDLLEHLLSSLSTIGIFIYAFCFLNLILKGNLSYELGLYGKVIKRNIGDEIFSFPFLSMILAHLSTLSYLFLLPFIVTISSAVNSYQSKDRKKLIFLILGILLFLGNLAMVFKLTLDISESENFTRLHARYYFMTIPFFIIAFVCFCDKLKWTKFIKITLLASFLIISFANIVYFFPVYANYGLLIVDNPYLVWFIFSGEKIIIYISVFSLITIIYYIRSTRRRYLPYILLLIICCFISNYGEMKFSLAADQGNKTTFAKYIPFIKSNIQRKNATVAMVCSEFPYRLQTAFWLPYRYTIAYDQPRGSDINREMIPMETEYIILFDDYNLNFSTPFTKKITSGQCSIISLQLP